MVCINLSMANTLYWLCPPAVIISEQIKFVIQRYILVLNTATYLSKLSFVKQVTAY